MTIILWTLSYAVAVGVGVFIGFLWGRANAHKHYARVIVDHHEPLPRVTVIQRIFAVVIALIAVLLVVQNSVSAQNDREQSEHARAVAERQKECNQDLYEAINARSQATESDQQALLTLVETLLNTQPRTPEDSQAILQQYRDTIIRSNEERQANPYPEPRCGE